MKEWIEFHRLVGVDHFYLYDNQSEDNPRAVLANYIEKGIVTYFDWPNREEENWGDRVQSWVWTTQIPAYYHACNLSQTKTKWLALIDSDEFIVPAAEKTLTAILKKHENRAGIAIRWQVYGTSGVEKIPKKKLMIELLTMRSLPEDPINGITKIIVQPVWFSGFKAAPHTGSYKEYRREYAAQPDEIRINHYINRDRHFYYHEKVKGKETIDNVKWSEEHIEGVAQKYNDVEDRIMDRFIGQLKKRMGFHQ